MDAFDRFNQPAVVIDALDRLLGEDLDAVELHPRCAKVWRGREGHATGAQPDYTVSVRVTNGIALLGLDGGRAW